MEKSWDAMMTAHTGASNTGTWEGAVPFAPEGYLCTTRENREWMQSRSALERARDLGVVLEATVLLCDAQYTLWLDLGCMRGRMAREDVQLCQTGEEVRDIAVITRVGKSAAFVVVGFARTEGGEEVAVLSRKEAQRRCREQFLDRCIPGHRVAFVH